MRKYLLTSIIAFFLLLTLANQSQAASAWEKEYIFPIEYSGDVTKTDVIGLRIYKNTENKDPFSWYKDNVVNPKSTLPSITADGYRAVKDDRTVYIQASNLDLTKNPVVFYTNIYVLAYNQNASPETIEIYNQMVANIKFNKNIMDLFCLKNQYEAVKEKLRRDTIRKADYYQIKKVFDNFSGSLNLQAGTYVPGMSISTWPSWSETLGRQLGAVLPVDPLNVMAVNLVGCTNDSQCGAGQCAGGYCSLCAFGFDPRTCWNERTKDYQPVDGFVYKYQNNVLTIRYEYPQLQLPQTEANNCFLGCIKNNLYYNQGSCLSDGTYCDAGNWPENRCGDGEVRCNEKCDCLNMTDIENCHCADGCLGCKQNFHSEGTLCVGNTVPVTVNPQTSLSVAEQKRWTGSGLSAAYAISCKDNALINNKGVCVCKTNYHEETVAGQNSCQPDSRMFVCQAKPETGAVWNTVESYIQNWDGEKWLPFDDLVTEYNTTASTTSCRYKCAEFYDYNSATGLCEGTSRPIPCPAKPANNTVWNNDGNGNFTQVWTGTAWFPDTVPTQFSDSVGNNTCNFKCEVNFHWDGSSCVSNIGSACTLPGAATTENIWQDSDYVCRVLTCVDHATLSDNSCVCDTHYTLSGNICQADTQIFTCTGKPADSMWYYLDSYNQVWDGSTWQPADATAVFSATPSIAGQCFYKCNPNFTWDGTSCVSNAVCGDGVITPNTAEVCDDGVSNGLFGFCNDTCSGIVGIGDPLFYDNFENQSFTDANWQQGYCPPDTGCVWTSRAEYPAGSGNHTFKSVGGDDGVNYARDQYVKKSGMENLLNVDVLMMVEYTSACSACSCSSSCSCLRDASIIVRRSGDTSKSSQNYYSLITNDGSTNCSPMSFKRIINGTASSSLGTSGAVNITDNNKYWLRVQVYNDISGDVVLRAMYWQVGQLMPTNWNLSATDSADNKINTSGGVGLGGWRINTLYFDNFQVYNYCTELATQTACQGVQGCSWNSTDSKCN